MIKIEKLSIHITQTETYVPGSSMSRITAADSKTSAMSLARNDNFGLAIRASSNVLLRSFMRRW